MGIYCIFSSSNSPYGDLYTFSESQEMLYPNANFFTSVPLWREDLSITCIRSSNNPKRLRSLITECHLEFLHYSVIPVNWHRPSWLNTEVNIHCDGEDGGWWGQYKKDGGRVGPVWHHFLLCSFSLKHNYSMFIDNDNWNISFCFWQFKI